MQNLPDYTMAYVKQFTTKKIANVFRRMSADSFYSTVNCCFKSSEYRKIYQGESRRIKISHICVKAKLRFLSIQTNLSNHIKFYFSIK
jgi:hypothetical protein